MSSGHAARSITSLFLSLIPDTVWIGDSCAKWVDSSTLRSTHTDSIQIPCLFALLLGLIVWLNFNRFVDDTMYIYWPVILIGLSVALLFLPAPAIYYRSREWFLNSMVCGSLGGNTCMILTYRSSVYHSQALILSNFATSFSVINSARRHMLLV